jgi:Ser/Thr protein kinase RdoA (MazF antagonist)
VLARDRWVFIDWDGAGPGTRLWDLGYAAHGFVGMAAGNDPQRDAPRLAAFADGYGLSAQERDRFPDQIEGHTRAMYRLLCDGAATGQQPWARLHAEGHADHWGPAADYIGSHRQSWLAAITAQDAG